MERVLPAIFTNREVQLILDYARKEFEPLEKTQFNSKLRDLKFDLFWNVIYDKIKESLPSSKFEIKGGFFNETNVPYPVHSDGARFTEEKILCTVLLPLEMKFENVAAYNDNDHKLFVCDQTSDLATLFKMNVKDQPDVHTYRVARTIDDYNNMVVNSTGTSFCDSHVMGKCDHLSQDELFGLSVKKEIPWEIGSCIIFHPHSIHFSSNFLKLGVKSKTNLVYSLKQFTKNSV